MSLRNPWSLACVAMLTWGCGVVTAPLTMIPTDNYGRLGQPGTYTARRTASSCHDKAFFLLTVSQPSWRDLLERLPPSAPRHRLAYMSVDATHELYFIGSKSCQRVDAVYVVREGFDFESAFPDRPQARDVPGLVENATDALGETVDEVREDIDREDTPPPARGDAPPPARDDAAAAPRVDAPRLSASRRLKVTVMSARISLEDGVEGAQHATLLPAARGLSGAQVRVTRSDGSTSEGTLRAVTSTSIVLEQSAGGSIDLSIETIDRLEVLKASPARAQTTEALWFDSVKDARRSRSEIERWRGSKVVVALKNGVKLWGRLDAVEGTRFTLELTRAKTIVIDMKDVESVSR